MLHTFFRLTLLMCFTAISLPAFADNCSDQAQRAANNEYNRVYNQCTNGGGGGDDCRYNSDCGFGQECNAGRCVNRTESCTQRCSARYSDGRCYQYASDFCGYQPQCAARCTARYSDGRCYQYSGDVCAEGGVSCYENCTARYSDGRCYQYGPDSCND